MDQLLIACDLHNTLLRSGPAWKQAFCELSGADAEMIAAELAAKCPRRLLAEQLGLSYADVYALYGELVRVDRSVVAVVSCLRAGRELVLISSAGRVRVEQDLHKLDGLLTFDGVYTKETFRKDSLRDWEALRDRFGADRILYIGNDPVEDLSPAPFVQTLLVPGIKDEVKCDED